MKRNDQLRAWRELDESEQVQRLKDLEQELMGLRFKHASGQLEQTAQLAVVKKQISRLKTVINESKSETAQEQAAG